MTTPNIFTGLLQLQGQFSNFFSETQTSIIDYVQIRWHSTPVTSLRERDMPDKLRQAITETLLTDVE